MGVWSVFWFLLQQSQLLVHLNDMMAALQNQHISFSRGCVLAQLVGFLQMPLRFVGLLGCFMLLVSLHNQNGLCGFQIKEFSQFLLALRITNMDILAYK